MLKEEAEQAISEMPPEKIEAYKDYWEKIAPKDDAEYFWRWVFSFLSVHTTWSANVRSYSLLRKHWDDWRSDKDALNDLIVKSGVGLHTRRVKGIWDFTDSFLTDPTEWKKDDNETWVECRDRLQKQCYGLGLTKTAFALELCYPTENESTCLDTHMLQLYGHKTASARSKAIQYGSYVEMEKHWIDVSTKNNIPPYIARCIYWDEKQEKNDSKYWSYVLEQ